MISIGKVKTVDWLLAVREIESLIALHAIGTSSGVLLLLKIDPKLVVLQPGESGGGKYDISIARRLLSTPMACMYAEAGTSDLKALRKAIKLAGGELVVEEHDKGFHELFMNNNLD